MEITLKLIFSCVALQAVLAAVRPEDEYNCFQKKELHWDFLFHLFILALQLNSNHSEFSTSNCISWKSSRNKFKNKNQLALGTSHLPRQFSARMHKQSTNQNLRSISDKHLTWNTQLLHISGNYLIMQQSQHNGPRESVGLSTEDNFHLK